MPPMSEHTSSRHPEATDIVAAALREWPLPMPGTAGDKEVRGHMLIVGGSREMPGAVILAANAAMRAGAGKLTIATSASVAALVAMAIPESRVISLEENAAGGPLASNADLLAPLAGKVDAMLVGPGMLDHEATSELVRVLLPHFRGVRLILDACAMGVARSGERALRFEQPVLLTPHAGEMAFLTGRDKAAIQESPHDSAIAAAREWNAVLALKGALTVIASPAGKLWQHEGGNIGLAISGSGDTLAGIITGLAARGASLEQAAVWGVALHAMAGDQLALRFGVLGYLAREIAAEVPALLRTLGPG
jgi:ADP-dependent NAD(P)H-hydrate dehydratase